MKKLFATILLLMCFSFAFAGKSGSSNDVVASKSRCVDSNGKVNPKITKNTNCNRPPTSCGCLFHEIEEFIKNIFK